MRLIEESPVQAELRARFGSSFQAAGDPEIIGMVWPESEPDMSAVLAIAARARVPVVPQGSGTSPYGGAAPQTGIVVCLERMARMLDIDRHAQTARVQSGLIWQALIEQLEPAELMPRVYPSSFKFSTVGGFVGQGGVGLGSFEYGPIDRSVLGARVQTSEGSILTLEGKSLDLAVGAEGRTGIIVDVTLRLQPHAAMAPLVAIFDRLADLERCVADAATSGLPLWSVCLMDPAAVSMRVDSAPRREPVLPVGRYAALFSFRSGDHRAVVPHLRGVVLAAGGSLLPNKASHDVWADRFMTLQVRGTTQIPMQLRLPFGRLSALLAKIPPKVRAALAFEGVIADQALSVVLRFFFTQWAHSADENRRMVANLIELGKQAGGETYATGAFFLDEAEAVYGRDKLERLRSFREAIDPSNRFNPGKGFV